MSMYQFNHSNQHSPPMGSLAHVRQRTTRALFSGICHRLIMKNVMNEVNRLIKDGLQIKDVTVSSADRKASDTRSRPGVVVAVFRSVEAKQTCMDKKAKLRDNNRYRNVYLHHHQSREERLMASNFRTVLDAIQNNRSDITLRGVTSN